MLTQIDAPLFLSGEWNALWEDYGIEPLFAPRDAAKHFRNRVPSPVDSVTLLVEGNPTSHLVFVVPQLSPAADELFTKMIEAMKWRRETAHLIFLPKELPIASLTPAVEYYVSSLSPKVIVAMGDVAIEALFRSTTNISQSRGKFRHLDQTRSVVVMSTASPELLLQKPESKKLVWEDLKLVVSYLNGP